MARIFVHFSASVAPLTMPVVAIAPGFTNAFIWWPLYCSTATIELNTWPVASTPTVSTMTCSPDSCITRAIVNTFEIDWIENSESESPAVCTLPSGVTTAMPNSFDGTLASAGM